MAGMELKYKVVHFSSDTTLDVLGACLRYESAVFIVGGLHEANKEMHFGIVDGDHLIWATKPPAPGVDDRAKLN